MPDQEKHTLELADDKISEITKKITADERKSGADIRAVFGNITDNTVPQETLDSQKTKDLNPSVVIKNLRTFQGDVAEAIQKQNASVVTVALAERKRTEERKVAEQKVPTQSNSAKQKMHPNQNGTLMILLSIILVLLGAGTIFGLYTIQKNNPPTVIKSPEDESMLGYTTKGNFDAGGADREIFSAFINNEKSTVTQDPKGIHYLSLVKEIAGIRTPFATSDLFELLKTKAPNSLIRAFNDDFMLGLYNDQGNEVFLIISLESFERAYSGMLEWEKTMNEDIGVLFSKRSLSLIERDATTLATTSTRVTNFDLTPGLLFDDETIRNRDARILRNSRGETIFLYSFLDEKTLIITSSEATLSEISNKLISERLIR